MMDASFRVSSPEIDRHLRRVLASGLAPASAPTPERQPLEVYVARARAMRAREVRRLSAALAARTIDGVGRAAEVLGRRLRAWAAVRARACC